MNKCKNCGKELDKKGRNKTGFCQVCFASLPKTEEANRKNSEALKEAHRKNPEKWEDKAGKRSGFCSKEWMDDHLEVRIKSSNTLRQNICK